MEGNWGDTRVNRRTMLKGSLGAAVGAASVGSLIEKASAAPTKAARKYSKGARRGGTMVIATGDGMGRDFFIGNSFGPQALSWYQLAFPLFRYAPGTYNQINGLASGYQKSRDSLTHTVTLREGLTFHDGSRLDANAVVQNLQAAFNMNDPLRGPGVYQMIPLFWGGFPGIVKSLQAVDRRRIRITLTEPRADLRGALSFLPIFNPRVLADKNYGTDLEAMKAAGSGPFRIANFRPGQFVEYTKVRGFYEEAYLDRLRLQLVPDATARFLALRGNQAHVAIGLSKADWDAIVENRAYAKFVSQTSNNVFLSLNATKNRFLAGRQGLREALLRGTNRAAYVSSFWGRGIARVSSQITLPPGVNGHNPALKPVPYDQRGARAALTRAGVSDVQLSIIAPPAFAAAPELSAMLQAMKGDLSRIGIDLRVSITDVPGWLAGIPTNDISVAPYGGSGGNGVAIASLYFRRPLTAIQPPSRGGFRKLLEEAAVEREAVDRDRKLRRLMALSAAWVSGIPIAYTFAAAAGRANVRGLAVSAAPIDPQNRAWIA